MAFTATSSDLFHEGGENGMFSLFKTAKKDNTITEFQDLLVHPKIPIQDTSRSFQFIIEPCSDWFLLSETRFEIDLKITTTAGADITAYSKDHKSAAFDNIPGALCIKNLVVRANDTIVSDSMDNYAIGAYVIVNGNFDKATLDTKSELFGYYLEKNPGNTDIGALDGLKKRYAMTQGSLWYHLSSPLFSPYFMMSTCQLPMVRLQIEV